jgi:hypothetical protein
MALLHTAEFKRILTQNGFAKQNSNDVQADARRLASLPNWFKVDSTVDYRAYDFISKQYSKKFTYTIGNYITPELIHDPASLAEIMNDGNLQRTRLREIFEAGLLQKRYDYYFTGLNTEIIDLNLELRNTYFQLFPQNAGSIRFREQYFNGTGGEAQLQISVLKATQSDIQQKISELTTERDRLSNTVREFANNTSDPPVRRAAERIAQINSQLETRALELTRATEELETQYPILVEQALAAQSNRLASELQNNYITQSELVALPVEEILPVSFEYGVVEALSTLGADKENGSIGAVLLGAVELNLNSLADLVNLDLIVRGDPYWLGQPRGESVQGAPFDIGGNSLYLELNFPLYPDDTSGFINNLGDFSVSGVYRVYRVQANYTQGRFEMTLTTFRDVITDNLELQEYLDKGYVETRDIVAPPPTQQIEQNETDSDSTSTERTRRGNSTGASNDTTAVGSDSGGGHSFDNRVDSNLRSLLSSSADATGVTITTTSGFRGPGGSGRHNGFASDIALTSGGRRLSVSNAEDRRIIENFTREFRDRARTAGYTPSVGWADHTAPRNTWYMGGNTGHYDIALGVNVPESGRTTYWGNGSSAAGAPDWLIDVMRGNT